MMPTTTTSSISVRPGRCLWLGFMVLVSVIALGPEGQRAPPRYNTVKSLLSSGAAENFSRNIDPAAYAARLATLLAQALHKLDERHEQRDYDRADHDAQDHDHQ